MTRSPAGPNPAQWGRREPVSFGTGCTGDCVSSRPSDGPGSHVPAALEEIRERNTHRQSASNPYGRRRFVNFVVLDASEPYFTKSELRLRIPELLAKPVNRPVEWNSARGMRRIQVGVGVFSTDAPGHQAVQRTGHECQLHVEIHFHADHGGERVD